MSDVLILGGDADAIAAARFVADCGRRAVILDPSSEPPPVPLALPDPWIESLLPDGKRLALWRDVARSAGSIRAFSEKDAQRWPSFCERLHRLATFVHTLYAEPPPEPMAEGSGSLLRLLGSALRARRMGRDGLDDLLRLLPMPLADLLDDEFESEALKGLMSGLAVRDLQQGPRSGGTTFTLLHGHVGCAAGVFRRESAVVTPPAGMELRRGVKLKSIAVKAGKATGVVLDSGVEIPATLILSALDPERTLLQLVDPGWLDPELARSVRNIRSRGVAAIVRAQLDRDPGFRSRMVAPSPDYVEKAYDCSKYRRVSDAPVIEAAARETKGAWHVEARVQYVPHTALRESAERRSFGQATLALLGLRSERVEVLAPSDLESACGWPQGQPQHAEMALDQAFYMRPTPELAQYRTPIAGLWLCGPAMHPGLPGMSGRNAAHKALATA